MSVACRGVMPQLFVSAPFYVIAARGWFARVDSDVEAAAADLGATPGQVFRTVTLRLIAPSLIAGAVLAWALERGGDPHPVTPRAGSEPETPP